MLISLASLSRLASLALVPVENSLDAVAGVLGIDIEPPPRPSTSSAPATPPTQDVPSLPSPPLSVSPSTSTSSLKTLLLVEKLNNGEINNKKSTTSPEPTPTADTFAGLATLKRAAPPARPHPQHLLDMLPFPLIPFSRSPVPVSTSCPSNPTTTITNNDVGNQPECTNTSSCPPLSLHQPSSLKARATIGSGTAGSSTSSTSTSFSSGYHLRPIAGNSRTNKSNPALDAAGPTTVPAVSRPSSASQSSATSDPVVSTARKEEWSRAIDDANMTVIRASSPASGDQKNLDATATAAAAAKKKKNKNKKKKRAKQSDEIKAEAVIDPLASSSTTSFPTASDSALSPIAIETEMVPALSDPKVDLSSSPEAMKAVEVESLRVDLARMRSLMGRASGVERVLRAAVVNALKKGGGADAGGASLEQRKKKTKVVPREGRRAAV